LILIFISFIASFTGTIFTILGIPIVYNAFFNRVIFDKWVKLEKFKEIDNYQIKKFAISFIQCVYEKENKTSFIRIFFISSMLNFLYGLILYTNIPKLDYIPNELYIFSMIVFFITGAIIMMFFEYYAYTENIRIINNFLKDNSYFNLSWAMVKLLLKIFVFLIVIFSIVWSMGYGIMATVILYFSPIGSFCFAFNLFPAEINGIARCFLLLPMISIICPLIFFIFIQLLHSKFTKILTSIIENIDSFARYIHQQNISMSKETFDRAIIWIFTFLLIASFGILVPVFLN